MLICDHWFHAVLLWQPSGRYWRNKKIEKYNQNNVYVSIAYNYVCPCVSVYVCVDYFCVLSCVVENVCECVCDDKWSSRQI